MAAYLIRFPDDLYERVKGMADSERRSINSQILTLVEDGLNENDRRLRGSARQNEGLEARRDSADS